MFDSLLIIRFVFRLVAAPRGQGCRATLCELWEQCAAAGIELPQDEPPAASTACEAREKLDEAAFRRVHRDILAHSPDGALWKGHRVFAVDGSKITLPRELLRAGCRIPNDNAHCPQGMVSVFTGCATASRSTSTSSARDERAAADTTHCLATSLLEARRHSIPALSDLYHGRWQIEEGYKTGKAVIERFHAKSERGVRQELYAAFTLITLARLFANRCDHDISHCPGDDGLPAMRANFRNGLRLVGREIEAMFLRQSEMVAQSVRRIMTGSRNASSAKGRGETTGGNPGSQ